MLISRVLPYRSKFLRYVNFEDVTNHCHDSGFMQHSIMRPAFGIAPGYITSLVQPTIGAIQDKLKVVVSPNKTVTTASVTSAGKVET